MVTLYPHKNKKGRGAPPPPPPHEMTCGFLIQLVFCKKTMWFIGVEGSAPAIDEQSSISVKCD